MSFVDTLILDIKRERTPVHRFLKSVVRFVLRPPALRPPAVLKGVFRAFYEIHYGCIAAGRTVVTMFYRHPLFVARCQSVGKNLGMDGLPFVHGHVQIELGDNVWLGGKVTILSGSMGENPRFVMGNHAELGWNVIISVNQSVILEDHVRVSYDCRISDSDGHPREADLRAACKPVRPQDIRPVRVCRYAWIGNGTHIMKGVTIGEGAVIGANSVVISDIPPYCLAMGNPAQVLFRNFGKPSKQAASSA